MSSIEKITSGIFRNYHKFGKAWTNSLKILFKKWQKETESVPNLHQYYSRGIHLPLNNLYMIVWKPKTITIAGYGMEA